MLIDFWRAGSLVKVHPCFWRDRSSVCCYVIEDLPPLTLTRSSLCPFFLCTSSSNSLWTTTRPPPADDAATSDWRRDYSIRRETTSWILSVSISVLCYDVPPVLSYHHHLVLSVPVALPSPFVFHHRELQSPPLRELHHCHHGSSFQVKISIFFFYFWVCSLVRKLSENLNIRIIKKYLGLGD